MVQTGEKEEEDWGDKVKDVGVEYSLRISSSILQIRTNLQIKTSSRIRTNIDSENATPRCNTMPSSSNRMAYIHMSSITNNKTRTTWTVTDLLQCDEVSHITIGAMALLHMKDSTAWIPYQAASLMKPSKINSAAALISASDKLQPLVN